MELREKLQTLVEERVNVWEETAKPLVLQDEMTPEEKQTYENAETRLGELDKEIDTVTRAIERETAETASAERRAELLQAVNPGITGDDVREDDKRYSAAFWNYIRLGEDRISDDDRTLLEARSPAATENRALGSGVGSEGGFLVPEDFWMDIIEARDRFGGVRNAPVTQITTDNGRDLPIPTDNEAGVKGELVAENGAATEDDPAFGQTILKAFLWSSKLVKVPRTLMQDNAFDLEAYLSGVFGRRIGRIQADFYHDGTGTNEPQGIITGTAVGHTTAAAQLTTLLYDDFVNLEHSVDPAYREMGHYLLSDGALKASRLIKDADGRPIWVPAMAADVPSTINGYGYTVVMELAALAANAKPIVFGDLSYYWIRDVIGFEAIRLNELFAQNRQVGFLAWARSDGRSVNPGNDPYKVLQMAAS